MTDERYYSIRFAKVAATLTGDNTIVSAVPGRKIRVISIMLTTPTSAVLNWKSGSGTEITGDLTFAANGNYSMSSEYGLVETSAGEALILKVSSDDTAHGHISYRVLPG